MKTKLPLLFTIATVAGASLAAAQDEPRPPLPPGGAPPAEAPAPPPPPGEGGRPPGGPDGERRGPRDDHGPRDRNDGPRDGDHGPKSGPGDGQRGPGGPRDGEHNMGGPRDGFRGGDRRGGDAAARQQKPTAYLGVSTAPVPAALGAQLSLPEGFGLLVEQVVPESPAAKAGVERYDVLKLLNDQQLADPDQLAALVRAAGKDTDVSLTVLRKGSEQKLTVKVGERLLPEKPRGGMFGDFNWRVEPLRQLPEVARDAARRAEEQGRRFQEQARGFQQKMGEFQKRLQEWQKNPSGAPPEAPKLEQPKAPAPPPPPADSAAPPQPPAPADLLRESRPGGAPQVRVDQDGNVTTWNTAQAHILIRNDRGEVNLRTENGSRHATVKNPKGDIVFDGPVDTEEQRRALPEDVRRRIELSGVDALVRGDGPTAQAFPKSSGEEALRRSQPAEREIQ